MFVLWNIILYCVLQPFSDVWATHDVSLPLQAQMREYETLYYFLLYSSTSDGSLTARLSWEHHNSKLLFPQFVMF